MDVDLLGVVNRAVAQALRHSEPPPPSLKPAANTPAIVGEFFARMAESEGAAVDAFRSQVLELQGLNSPSEFIEHARGAARCEEQHKETLAGLAIRFGAEPQTWNCAAHEPRDLYDFALHNATVGCVRETFEAAQLAHQSQRARDEEVRRVLRRLADDGTRHAAYFWDIHRWALSQLSPARGRSIRAAQRETFQSLRDEIQTDVPWELSEWVGVARGPAASTLLDAIEEELWPED